MIKVALTGIIGAGKSTIIQILLSQQIPILNCDKVNEQLLFHDEDVKLELIEIFGNEILDQTTEINKQKLSDIVFQSNEKRKQLEQIIHPKIYKKIQDFFSEYKEEKFVVVEVPLLFEVGWEKFFDEVWVVTCPYEKIFQRLERYRNVSIDEAKKRLKNQLSQEEKEKMGDVIFRNDTSCIALEYKVKKEILRLKESDCNVRTR